MLQFQIGSHRFKVRIEESDKPAMVQAARRVNQMLEQERAKSSVIDGERSAIIVALRCMNEAPSGTGAANFNELEGLLDEALEQARLK